MTAILGASRPLSERYVTVVAEAIIIDGLPGQDLGILMAANKGADIGPGVSGTAASIAVGCAPALTCVDRRKLLITMHDIAGMVDVRGERGGPDSRNCGEYFDSVETQSEKKIRMLCDTRQPIPAMP